MALLGELMNNLIKFGESDIYVGIEGKPYNAYMLKFYITTSSDLVVDKYLLTYDKPFERLDSLHKTMYPKKTILVNSYGRYEEIHAVISSLIVRTILSGNYIFQHADEVYDLNDNDVILGIIYNTIMAILNVSNADICETIDSDIRDFGDKLIASAIVNYKEQAFSKDMAPYMIDRKCEEFGKRYYDILDIINKWKKCLPKEEKASLDSKIKMISIDKTSSRISRIYEEHV